MKFVYCANCGKKLAIYRKALPKFATIIDIVEHHECGEEVANLDLNPQQVPTFNQDPSKNRFVSKLDTMNPMETVRAAVGGVDTNTLRDRRFDKEPETKSTAPDGVLDMIKSMSTSEPENPIEGGDDE
jgi:hypothetical protein